MVDDLAAATARAVELESQANELKSHLADLLKAKEDDEKHLLEKFQDLLNEKKLKIRQQQRLLASAEVDPARLENAGASQNTVRKAKASRGSKRKVVQEPEDESDDGFEKMDVDASAPNPIEEDPEMDVRQTTDEELEDATASDTQDSDEEPPQPTVKGKGKGKTKASAKTKVPVKSPASRKTKGSTSSRTTRATKGKTATAPSEVDGQDVDAQPPPRRTLPFKSKAKEKTPEPVKTADDETETDDDEL